MELKPFGIKAWKFIHTPIHEDFRFTILEGSVRSSKTFSMMVKLLALCRYDVAGWRIITGVSKNAIFQNVLKDLFDLVGRKNYAYNRNTGLLNLFGVEWLVIGAKDEGSFKLIQGLTVGVAYCDELTNMPQSFYMMLTTRMSPAGARLYATTNPENPYHYVKTQIIDNEDLRGQVRTIHFTLDDNPNLSRETRQIYEKMYKGMFYLRYIKGLWVMAEGAIYRDVWGEDVYYDDDSRPPGLFLRGGFAEHFVGVDYGTHNPCVFLDIWDDGQTLWVEREYYYDSVQERFQKTDAQYARDLEEFLGPNKGAEIIIDPSAASFKAELLMRGMWVTDAVNDVVDGIRKTSSMLGQRKVRIHKRNCPKTDIEMQTYSWDPKAAARGEEKPIKTNDHGPDALRYPIETKIQDWRLAA